MKTHKQILSAIWTLADFEPLEIKMNLRGSDFICLDGYEVRAYKVGSFDPLIIKWEDLTPVEALRLKRACRPTLERMEEEALSSKRAYRHIPGRLLKEAEIRLTQIMRVKETFEKSPFGC